MGQSFLKKGSPCDCILDTATHLEWRYIKFPLFSFLMPINKAVTN